jgi:chemotaxis protein MotB
MPKKKKVEHENSERWLLTYADLITLLLGLFVILYSMSQVDLAKFKTMGQAFKTVFVGDQGIPAPGAGSGPYEDSEGGAYPDTSDCYLSLKVEETLKELKELAGEVSVEVDERGVVVRLMETLMFDVGHAVLRPEARIILSRLTPVLVKSGRPIAIEGHTDNRPISTPEFPSNWQLSAARSSNVVYFLIHDMGVPEGQVSAGAYADQRPIAPNDTEEGRSRNRRVDIVFLKGQWKPPSGGRPLADIGKR